MTGEPDHELSAARRRLAEVLPPGWTAHELSLAGPDRWAVLAVGPLEGHDCVGFGGSLTGAIDQLVRELRRREGHLRR